MMVELPGSLLRCYWYGKAILACRPFGKCVEIIPRIVIKIKADSYASL